MENVQYYTLSARRPNEPMYALIIISSVREAPEGGNALIYMVEKVAPVSSADVPTFAAFKEAEHVCQDSVTKCSRLQLPCQVGARPFAWQRSESATPWVSPNSLSDSLTCRRCVSKAAGQLRLGATEHSGYRLCFRTLAGLAKFCQTDPLSIVTNGFAITQQLSPEWCIKESVLACTGSATEHVTNSKAHVPRLCFRSVEGCR